jgi:uncharacterized protein YutE (UPF0331/DUF86 family)
MGSHVVAVEKLGTVEQSQDIPRLLRQHRLIDADLERRWVRMIGFRNVLVQAYTELDRTIVHDVA